MTLRELGFDAWFEARAAEAAGADGAEAFGGAAGCAVARVAAVDRGTCLLWDGRREGPGEASGRLLHLADGPADLPCVGDWVLAQWHSNDTAAVVHGLLPRRTVLRRKAAGRSSDGQMIAANVDTAFLVQSCQGDFNPARLDRYLVMAADGGVEPVVVLTKTDLVPPEELERLLAGLRAAVRAEVLALSNATGAGLEAFAAALVPGRTYCLLGSSGVGKSTLLNRLLGREALATRSVSGTGEGVHTTTRRQLLVLGCGALVVDTPGMRELGLVGSGEAVDRGFDGFGDLAARCRFADCSHRHEPGC